MLLSDLAISMKNVAETIPCSFPKETPQEDKRHFQVVGNDFDEVFLANPVVKNCESFGTEKISTWMRSIERSDVKKRLCISSKQLLAGGESQIFSLLMQLNNLVGPDSTVDSSSKFPGESKLWVNDILSFSNSFEMIGKSTDKFFFIASGIGNALPENNTGNYICIDECDKDCENLSWAPFPIADDPESLTNAELAIKATMNYIWGLYWFFCALDKDKEQGLRTSNNFDSVSQNTRSKIWKILPPSECTRSKTKKINWDISDHALSHKRQKTSDRLVHKPLDKNLHSVCVEGKGRSVTSAAMYRDIRSGNYKKKGRGIRVKVMKILRRAENFHLRTM